MSVDNVDSADRSCPCPATLRRIIEAPADSPTEAELLAHLDSCSVCQQALDEIVGEVAITSEWKPALKADSPASQSLGDLVDHLKRHSSQVENPRITVDELTFLRPTDAPYALGRLGHYEVIDLIAQGGMGLVLKAIDPDLDREVAIKVLSPVLAVADGARRRFLREARAAASLDHPNVLPVFGVGEEDSLPYLVMPLVNGESLQERISRCGALSVIDIVSIGAKLTRGLDAAHQAGLVHRDVKPANVLLDADGSRVWITDFGLARAAEDSAVSNSGLIAGTPQYMAPEQFRTSDVDARADLFSLGGVLYAMATGRPPFDGDSAVTAMRSVCEDEPDPPDRINAEIPTWLARQIMSLLKKSPDHRPASAGAVAEVLERQGIGDRSDPSELSSKRGRRLALAALAMSIVALFAGAFYLNRPAPEPQPFHIGDAAFASLQEALEAAENGDKIEIAGNNELILQEPLAIEGKSIRIIAGTERAAATMTLIVTGEFPALSSDSKLVLEGLELKHISNGGGSLLSSSSDLYLLNCRIESSAASSLGGRDAELKRYALVKLTGSGTFEAVNSEFYSPGATAITVSDVPKEEARAIVHNNCATLVIDALRLNSCRGHVRWNARRSFFAGRTGVLAITNGDPIRLKANVDHCVFGFKGTVIGQAGMSRQEFRRLNSWEGDANIYANCETFLKTRATSFARRPRLNVDSLTDWIDFWDRKESRAHYIKVQLRESFAEQDIPDNIDEIDAKIHLQLPPEAEEVAVDEDVGPDLDALGQGENFLRIRNSDKYPDWIKKVTGMQTD